MTRTKKKTPPPLLLLISCLVDIETREDKKTFGFEYTTEKGGIKKS